jgi:predicted SprT family Zn-dependent metalloprotease
LGKQAVTMSTNEGLKEHERLTLELETALLRELRSSYQDLNAAHFRRTLKIPTIELGDAERYLGRWHRETRSIEIGRRLVLERPWGVVVEVLKHEMAHQFAHEVLGAIDETAHGPAFRAVCERAGVDPAATGVKVGEGENDDDTVVRVLRKVQKLLALAESQNQHEAEAAMAMAQRLMLQHNLDLVQAGSARRYVAVTLGDPTSRMHRHEKTLAGILGAHFFVQVLLVSVYRPLLGKGGTVVEVAGAPENVELARYVYAYVLHAAEQLWRAHKEAHDVASDRDRLAFLAGVMRGFDDKLHQEKQRNAERGLVWAGDADLQGWWRRRHPRVVTQTGRASGNAQAHEAGRNAGSTIVLKKPVGASRSRGLALPGRS